jgi:hypothetical protein
MRGFRVSERHFGRQLTWSALQTSVLKTSHIPPPNPHVKYTIENDFFESTAKTKQSKLANLGRCKLQFMAKVLIFEPIMALLTSD